MLKDKATVVMAAASWDHAYLLAIAVGEFGSAIWTAKTRYVWGFRNPSDFRVWFNVIGFMVFGAIMIIVFFAASPQ